MSKYDELVKALRCCATMTCKGDECKYMILGCHDCFQKLHDDAAAAIEALQAEVKRLKECNDELREAQTYIDHYGDKWMTSAKDVPTSAYNHGYMDGKNEAEAAQPHWVRCEDAVPEPHKNALFCGSKGGMFVGWTYGYGEDGVFRAFVHGGNARTFTHWMPLPEPPQEVQDANKR